MRALTSTAVFVALMFAVGPAYGDDVRQRARLAYDRGAAAFEAQNFETALRELRAADELVPNDTALAMALRSALRGDLALPGMELAERARTRDDPEVVSLAREARQRFAARLGRLRVRCKQTCQVSVEGRSLSEGKAAWLSPGQYSVLVQSEGSEQVLSATIRPRAVTDLTAEPPRIDSTPTPKTTPAELDGGVSPVWFWVGAGATAAVGAVAVWSTIDTERRYDRFAATRSDKTLRDEGQAAERRRDLLLGATTGLAVITATVGLVFVDWPNGTGSGAQLRVSPGQLHGTF